MKIELFELEREQSTWENLVRYNLAESGVHPLTVADVAPGNLLSERLGYPQTNGSIRLRERISHLYQGTDPENVIVTNGTAEANFLSILNLVEPGDEMVMMLPNYMQIWGVARAMGATVSPWFLKMTGRRWRPDLNELEQLICERTRLIAVCNPNNPTGAVLSLDEMEKICELADRVGAWVLSDEVYQGAELNAEVTPTMWGLYDRLLVNSGLSKAYGLPGLRIGWTISTKEKVAELWSYKDYTTIGPGILSDRLACAVLESDRRTEILERSRRIIRSQFPVIQDWIDSHPRTLSLVPPRAGAIAWVAYNFPSNSTALCRKLREEKDVLIVPGDHFKMDHYLRIGFGCELEILRRGLSLISEVLESLNRGAEVDRSRT